MADWLDVTPPDTAVSAGSAFAPGSVSGGDSGGTGGAGVPLVAVDLLAGEDPGSTVDCSGGG